MEVHRELRNGFLEVVYQDAMAVELSSRMIPFEREKLLQVRYKGGLLPSYYKADFVASGRCCLSARLFSNSEASKKRRF